MFLISIYLPIACSLGLLLFGRFLGFRGSSNVAIISMAFVCVLSVSICNFLLTTSSSICISLGSWVSYPGFGQAWSFQFDYLSGVMISMVSFLSFFIHVYSASYMSEDPHSTRFMAYIQLFTGFMLVLVLSNNFLVLFLGWEGIGLCSYFLIGFWYTWVQATSSALQAVIVNSVGDCFLCFYFFCQCVEVSCLDFGVLAGLGEDLHNLSGEKWDLLSSFALVVGISAKSAQFPLHVWLVNAMTGPSPVSALIHAATLVTSGVFLLISLSPTIEYSSVHPMLGVVGCLTCFFSGTIALVQNDINSIVAYSTCSQLGYMVLSLSMHNYAAGFFHLFNHAFFNALLFLSVGSLIHSLANDQDLRSTGHLLLSAPITYISILIGSCSLVALPFLTGFYSKDLIIENTYLCSSQGHILSAWISTLAVCLTAFYSVSLIALVFWGYNNSFNGLPEGLESSPSMVLVFSVLIFGSVFLGSLSADFFVGPGNFSFGNSLHILSSYEVLSSVENMRYLWNLLPLGACVTSIIICVLCYSLWYTFHLRWVAASRSSFSFLSHRWYLDFLYANIISKNSLSFSQWSFNELDSSFLEILGPFGLGLLFKILLLSFLFLSTGSLQDYISIFFWSIASLVVNAKISEFIIFYVPLLMIYAIWLFI